MQVLLRFFTAVILILFTMLPACLFDAEDTFTMTGTVVYISLEGGFYGIKGDDGKNYDPTNLKQEFQQDNLRVRFEAKELKDQASFHMWGTIIEIIEIEKL